MERRGIQTAGQRSSAGRLCEIIGSRQACYAVEQDHHVFLVLHEALSSLDDHLGHPLVVLGEFVEGGINDLDIGAFDRLLDIRHFFRSLVDEQDDEMNLGIVGFDRLGDLLHERRLSCLGGGYDHTSLPLADRAHKVHDSHGNAGAGLFQPDPFIGEDRRHIFKIIALRDLFRPDVIDRFDEKERSEFFALRLDSDISLDDIAGL